MSVVIHPDYADWLDLANAGDPQFQYEVGRMLFLGIQCFRNRRLGYRFLLQSAKQGWASAALRLSSIWSLDSPYYGKQRSNFQRALHWAERAALSPNGSDEQRMDAILSCGYICQFLDDHEQAVKYFTIAAEQGSEDAALIVETSYAGSEFIGHPDELRVPNDTVPGSDESAELIRFPHL